MVWNLEKELSKDYMVSVIKKVNEDRENHKVYPPSKQVFSALEGLDLEKIKVLILGQDPYHGPGQAHGMAFSVNKGVALPPSLRNIFKELEDDIGVNSPRDGYLQRWADEGVLLLNSVMTVRDGEPGSHNTFGWQKFTNGIISYLSKKPVPVVFILWGKQAQSHENLINDRANLIIKGPHPSPLSAYRGFFGSKPFSQANKYLIAQGIEPVDWRL